MRAVVVAIALGSACSAPIDSNKPVDAAVTSTYDGKHTYHDAPRALTDAGAGSGSAVVCQNQVTDGTNNQGHHNPGMDCMDSCHNHGFTIGGTLYTDSGGATIVSGATITVLDAFGNPFQVVSQTNGNFYSSFAMTYPLTIYASECPSIQMMTMTIADSSQIGCNQSGCHASGTTQGRVYIP